MPYGWDPAKADSNLATYGVAFEAIERFDWNTVMRPKVEIPTGEEEAEIQRGIALDPDSPELTDAQLAELRPAADALPPAVYAGLVRRRGPGKREAKALVTLRLDRDVLEGLRSSGKGWQSRANDALRKLVGSKA